MKRTSLQEPTDILCECHAGPLDTQAYTVLCIPWGCQLPNQQQIHNLADPSASI